MKKINFVDLKLQYLSIKEEIDAAIHTVIEQTSFIGGQHVTEFENKFADKCGVKHCVSVANGTDSLYIIMKMLGIGHGDEVITVANSWISSSETISQTGAKPVFIDIDKDYYTLNEDLIIQAINERTKAIIPVHLFGQMCDMEYIMDIANKHGIYVIEDCAQSHFSSFKNKFAGTFGIAGSFSFYPGKNLGAYGDAGCIITNDDELARKIRMFSRHGALIKHQHQIEGVNSRMDAIQAAILNVKIKYIDSWNENRFLNSILYEKYLSPIKELTLPKVRENTKHTFHLYVIKCERRDKLSAFLNLRGIETAIHYPSILPNLEAYSYLGHKKFDFPIAENNQHQILSLPMFPELKESDIKYIAYTIKEFYSN